MHGVDVHHFFLLNIWGVCSVGIGLLHIWVEVDFSNDIKWLKEAETCLQLIIILEILENVNAMYIL